MSNDRFVMPRPGDLLLCYNRTILDDGIDLCERLGLLRQHKKPPPGHPIYSHVAVYVGRGRAIEAFGRGLVINWSVDRMGKADVWSKRGLTRKQRSRIVNRAYRMQRQGYRYSYLDIAIQFAWLLFGLRIPWHLRDSVICSVFGYVCWQAAGIQIAKRLNCCPEDIAVCGDLEFRGRY